MREFEFELRLCATLEAEREATIARQLGGSVNAPANRVLDVLVVEPGPEFETRTAITPREIPAPAIEADVGAGRARYWKDAFDMHPDRARSVVDRAVECGFFERERCGGREYVRQTIRYPDWFARLIAIENKPDLGSAGDLETQLRKDVSLGLVDEVVLATEDYVTRAHLNRVPAEVGVWRFDGEEIEIIREPTPLSPDEPGIELVDEHPLRTDVCVVTPTEKRRKRQRLAERAYGKGWRIGRLPECAEVECASVAGASGLPYCRWYGRIVNPARCGSSCPGYDPADPPEYDATAERDARTPWVAEPTGKARRQSSFDHFN